MQYYFVMTQINAGANQRQKHQQYKYTKVIFQLVVIYFVCWYPSMIMSYMVPFQLCSGRNISAAYHSKCSAGSFDLHVDNERFA